MYRCERLPSQAITDLTNLFELINIGSKIQLQNENVVSCRLFNKKETTNKCGKIKRKINPDEPSGHQV